jgi:aryl-alcohol dehydrogenase-like predicted oxidoreductase
MLSRREFLGTAALAPASLLAQGSAKNANDMVYLGPQRVRLSRLAMGTGTKGGRGSSAQTRQLGLKGLADLYWYGYDQGVVFWDSADSYGSHPHLKEALRKIPRDKVTIMTKTRSKTAEEMRADLDRFRQEIGTDYLDIVLLHAVREADFPEQRKGAMEVLAEARERKLVRTHGVSCHSLEALKTAARTPWVQVDLARINPVGAMMDSDPDTVIAVLREMKKAGKGVIGMKILGEGALRHRVRESLQFALSLDCVDCFTIGAESREELADLIRQIPAASKS